MRRHRSRRPVKIFLVCVLAAAIALSASGCVSHKELKELWIVQGLAIDGDSQKGYNLTYQTLKPTQSGGGGGGGGTGGDSGDSQIFKSSGRTIFDAFRNATLQTGRKLYFSNNLVVVLSEKLCKEDVGRVLDVFQRDPDFQPDANVYLVKASPDKVLTAQINGMTLSARDISDISNNYQQSSKTVNITLSDLFLDMNTKVTDLILPVISLSSESSGGSSSGSSSGSQEAEKKSVLLMDGTAVYKNNRLAGYLTPSQTRGYLWVTGKPVNGVLVIEPQKGTDVSCEVVSNSAKTDVSLGSDGKPKIQINIDLSVNLDEVMGGAPNNVYQIKQTGKACLNRVVSEEAYGAVNKALKECGSDVFGFGMMIYRKYPRQWAKLAPQWSATAKDTDVTISVHSNISTVGQITK